MSIPNRLVSRASGQHARLPADIAIDQAVKTTLRADNDAFLHLPVPVRYRASGAMQAWSAARKLAKNRGERFAYRVADAAYPPAALYNDIADFMEDQSSIDFKLQDGPVVAGHCSQSVYLQAFWQRGGVIYEPTPALHQLLDATDVADNVPVTLLKLPVPAMCIVPDRSAWNAPGDAESIVLFEHEGTDANGVVRRMLTITIWAHDVEPWATWSHAVATFFLDDESRTISNAIDFTGDNDLYQGLPCKLLQHQPDQDRMDKDRARWHKVLNYVTKLLLYMTVDGVQITAHKPFSHAARVFPGLGKKKREQRLAEIDQLYDRFAIGPQALAEDLRQTMAGHGVSAHWRRGHLRMQAHGPAMSLRKMIFIMPTLVRSDLLGS